jgi:hypothetical protein
MGILIPSSNIYKTENNKIPQNVVKNVYYNTNYPFRSTKKNTDVYEEKYDIDAELSSKSNDGIHFNGQLVYSNVFFRAAYNYSSIKSNVIGLNLDMLSLSYTEIYTYGAYLPKIEIPNAIFNGIIDKIYVGYAENGYPNIKYKILYDVIEEDAIKSISPKNNEDWETTGGKQVYLTEEEFVNYDTIYENQKINKNVYDYETNYDGVLYRENGNLYINFYNYDNKAGIKSDASFLKNRVDQGIDNLSFYQGRFDKTKNSFVFDELICFCGFQTLGLSASHYSDTGVKPDKIQQMKGKRKTYIPKKIELSFFGDTVYADFERKEMNYGSGEPSIKREGNELFQELSFVNVDEDNASYEMLPYFSDKIVRNYKNGKETANIRCSISDYFDESGTKVIEIRGGKMSFDIGDEVIPMVYGADGKDHAMSLYKDGSSKQFRVCGIKFIYDGAVWQELALQEITKEV